MQDPHDKRNRAEHHQKSQHRDRGFAGAFVFARRRELQLKLESKQRKIRALFYYGESTKPIADILVCVSEHNAAVEAAAKAFVEFAYRHTGFALIDGDVRVKFERTTS